MILNLDKNKNGEPVIFHGTACPFRDACRLLFKWRHAKDVNERENVEKMIFYNQQWGKNQNELPITAKSAP